MNRKTKQQATAPSKGRNRGGDRLQRQFDYLIDSLSDLLGEIAALEINTMIVAEIAEIESSPWDIYQAIYSISRTYLEQLNIDPSLRDRYLNLRRQLELEYLLLLASPDSELYNSSLVTTIQPDLLGFSQPDSNWETIPSRLPNPLLTENAEAISAVAQLLHNYHFLQVLRRLGKSKTALDRRNQNLQQSMTENVSSARNNDITYAQTSVHLNGKIVNRYARAILTHPHKNQILAIHREGVQAGEQQWRRLLEFVLNIFHTKTRTKK